MVKDKRLAGADEKTPSVPQYFSWINNTNEGSTEAQTLINLEYFAYLKKKYGMTIKIYAWDAGNFDGSADGYGDVNSPRFKRNYPSGFTKVAERAQKLGIAMGLWGGPDGFGDTVESEKERYDFYVHLCRDYRFGLFKIDGVCGKLRKEKAPVYAAMLEECRKYVPDLIVLNHRLDLYEAEKNVTTFLWNGVETYTDVLSWNRNTAMHNRAYTFTRGYTPEMQRLCEDHGVCLSSSLDYFEDELIYQAFNRSLILAPEIYGNPWLLKDSEQHRLARIYNLHRRNRDLLVDGMIPRSDRWMGEFPASRGNGAKRFFTTGNNSWEQKTIQLTLDGSIGLTEDGEYTIIQRHPYDCHMADCQYGDTVELELMPFRAHLFEIARKEDVSPYLEGIAYEVIREDEAGNALEYKILADSKTGYDIREKAPEKLAVMRKTETDQGRRIFESAQYAINNDALEKRSLTRAGETSVPEIRAAREAFFQQETYVLRGCEAAVMFDGNADTFYDGQSRSYSGGIRIDGGCLRVDFGQSADADAIEITAFETDTVLPETPPQLHPEYLMYSENMTDWKTSDKAEISDAGPYTLSIPKLRTHIVFSCEGRKIRFIYKVSGSLRYMQIPCPMDRIFSVKILKDGEDITPKENIRANNLQPAYEKWLTDTHLEAEITIPERIKDGDFIAAALNGRHGCEKVCSVIEIDGQMYGSDRRAPEYRANMWEHSVCSTDHDYTCYFTLSERLRGKKAVIHTLIGEENDVNAVVWLCEKHN